MASQKAMINTLMFYHWDNTLFNNMMIPVSLNRDEVISAILLETSDFPLVITDLDTLKYSIEVWSKHRIDIWNKLIETTNYEYNPIENYDRTESTTDTLTQTGYGIVKGDGAEDKTERSLVKSGMINKTISGNIENGKSGSIDKSISGSYTDANTGEDINTNSVSAFNDNGFSDHEQNTLLHGLSTERMYNGYVETENYVNYKETEKYNSYEETQSFGYPDSIENPTDIETIKTTKNSGERTDKNFTDTRIINQRIHGNIGVTTTQQMIEQERNIVRFDIIDEIVKDYKTEFCILIY